MLSPCSPGGSTAAPPLGDNDSQLHAERANLHACAAVVFEFLQSKGLFAAERALRAEMDANFLQETSRSKALSRNLWQSRIEQMLDVMRPRDGESEGGSPPVVPMGLSQLGAIPLPNAAFNSKAMVTNIPLVVAIQYLQ